MQISVNVSVPQFKASDYAQSVAQLARFAVPSDKIELEITESVVMDRLSRLHARLMSLKVTVLTWRLMILALDFAR